MKPSKIRDVVDFTVQSGTVEAKHWRIYARHGGEVTSLREHVVLLGYLKGMGRQVECKVSAFEMSLPDRDSDEYALVMISDSPKDLLDGRYHLIFDGRVIPV